MSVFKPYWQVFENYGFEDFVIRNKTEDISIVSLLASATPEGLPTTVFPPGEEQQITLQDCLSGYRMSLVLTRSKLLM